MKRLMVAHLLQLWSESDKFRSAVRHDYYLEWKRDPGCREFLLSPYTHFSLSCFYTLSHHPLLTPPSVWPTFLPQCFLVTDCSRVSEVKTSIDFSP